MSTPPSNPGNFDNFGQDNPSGPTSEDLAAKNRAAVDVTDQVNKMNEGTDALLTTLSEHLAALTKSIQGLPMAFSDTADHIKKAADATEKMAASSGKVAKNNERTKKALDDQKFSIKDMLFDLKHGNVQGAIAEAFQGLPYSEKITGRRDKQFAQLGSGSFLDKIRGRGTFEGPVTEEGKLPTGAVEGLAGRLRVGGGAVGLAAASELFTPAAIYGAYRLAQQVNAQQKADLQVGQLTGEGRGAGIAAMGVSIPFLGTFGGEAGHLRGLNPFDIVGNKEAREIVMGVRGAGLRGDDARALEESVKGIVDDLGLSVQDAMGIAVPAIKEAGFSAGQLSTALSTMDDTAKSAHASIGDLTGAVKDLITSTAQFSRRAAQAAPGQLQSLEAQFQGTLIAGQPGQLGGFLKGPQREMIAQLSGFAPYEAYSQKFTAQFNADFTRILVNLARHKPPYMDWQEYVSMMMLDPTWQQLFGQTPIPSIVDLLNSVWTGTDQGKNVGGYLRKQQVQVNKVQTKYATAAVDNLSKAYEKAKDDAWWKGDKFDANKWGLVSKVDQKLSAQGISQDRRANIESDLKTAVASGDNYSIHKALKDLGDRIEKSMKNVATHSTVTVDPRYGRMLRANNIPAIEAAKGQRPKQGTSDWMP